MAVLPAARARASRRNRIRRGGYPAAADLGDPGLGGRFGWLEVEVSRPGSTASSGVVPLMAVFAACAGAARWRTRRNVRPGVLLLPRAAALALSGACTGPTTTSSRPGSRGFMQGSLRVPRDRLSSVLAVGGRRLTAACLALWYVVDRRQRSPGCSSSTCSRSGSCCGAVLCVAARHRLRDGPSSIGLIALAAVGLGSAARALVYSLGVTPAHPAAGLQDRDRARARRRSASRAAPRSTASASCSARSADPGPPRARRGRSMLRHAPPARVRPPRAGLRRLRPRAPARERGHGRPRGDGRPRPLCVVNEGPGSVSVIGQAGIASPSDLRHAGGRADRERPHVQPAGRRPVAGGAAGRHRRPRRALPRRLGHPARVPRAGARRSSSRRRCCSRGAVPRARAATAPRRGSASASARYTSGVTQPARKSAARSAMSPSSATSDRSPARRLNVSVVRDRLARQRGGGRRGGDAGLADHRHGAGALVDHAQLQWCVRLHAADRDHVLARARGVEVGVARLEAAGREPAVRVGA